MEEKEMKKEKQTKEAKEPLYKKVETSKVEKQGSNGFGKSVVIPFCSGILGTALVVGICFGIPNVRSHLLANSGSTTQTSSTSNQGSTNQNLVSLANFSETAVGVAEKVRPSIVGIKVTYSVSSPYARQSQSAEAEGSGIIMSEDGYILTNNHIVNSSGESSYQVSEATKITVTLYNDTTEYEAKIIGTDSQTDLAVIKIEKTGLTKAELANSEEVKVGEFCMAVGNPLGMQSSVTSGIVSAVNREMTDTDGKTYTLIQTDSAINSGNSGGALVNSEGKVIGINTLKISGTGVEGMGFAIPINSTLTIYEQLVQDGKVKRPYIGISGIDLDDKTASANSLVKGIYVKSIETFSSAEKAGVKSGDVIIAADGQNISTMDELNKIKNTKKIGDELTLKVNRNGKEQELKLTLQEQP